MRYLTAFLTTMLLLSGCIVLPPDDRDPRPDDDRPRPIDPVDPDEDADLRPFSARKLAKVAGSTWEAKDLQVLAQLYKLTAERAEAGKYKTTGEAFDVIDRAMDISGIERNPEFGRTAASDVALAAGDPADGDLVRVLVRMETACKEAL